MEITEGSSRSGKLIEGIKCIQAELLPSLTWQKRKTAVRCSDYTLQNPISGLFLFCFHFCFTKEPRFGSHDGFSGVLPEKTIRFLGGRPAIGQRPNHQALTVSHISGGKQLSSQMMGTVLREEPSFRICPQPENGQGGFLAADKAGGDQQKIAGKDLL